MPCFPWLRVGGSLLAALSYAALLDSGPVDAANLATQRVVSAEAGQSNCDAKQHEQWSLDGTNEVDVAYDGLEFVYSVTFTQNGTCLRGTLDDAYYPASGPISGEVSGSRVTFTFDYPPGSMQGTRTYTGTIDSSGVTSGTWTQTGDEAPNNGTWALENSLDGCAKARNIVDQYEQLERQADRATEQVKRAINSAQYIWSEIPKQGLDAQRDVAFDVIDRNLNQALGQIKRAKTNQASGLWSKATIFEREWAAESAAALRVLRAPFLMVVSAVDDAKMAQTLGEIVGVDYVLSRDLSKLEASKAAYEEAKRELKTSRCQAPAL